MRVIGIGDNVCDKYEHLRLMFPGGQAANFAVYAGMLGAESAYMGVFGRDEVAEHVIATLDELQVEHSRCRQYEGENGYARVTLVDGDRVFLGSNKGGVLKENPLNLDVEDLEYIKTFDHVHTTNNSYFDEQLPKLAEQGISVSYDFSGQWIDEERVKKVAPYITYAFLSCGSVSREDAEEICKKMFRAGCPMVIATRGSYGAVLFDGTQFYEQPPPRLPSCRSCSGLLKTARRCFLPSQMPLMTKIHQLIPESSSDQTYCNIHIRIRTYHSNSFQTPGCL